MPAVKRDSSSADRVAAELRDLIVSNEIAPGAQIRQEHMAERLGVSRAPLREALKLLSSEGLVVHTHNSGYTVARLSAEQFDEIYLMRNLLETELIRRIESTPESVLAELTELNGAMTQASDRLDLGEMQRLNLQFHFLMFRQSGQSLIVGELERLWQWAMPYHTVYLYDTAARERILREHSEMVEGLRVQDTEEVVRLMNQHRGGSASHLSLRFTGPAPR